MHLRTIPFHLVAADEAAIKATQDTSYPSSRSQRFSTALHTHAEILAIVPENPNFKHEHPPWTPYGYVLWHPLIARSQRMSEHHVHPIPSFLYEDLMRCHAAWLATGRIHSSLLDEVVETWRATKAGKKLIPLLNGTRKWFIRLDQMSPKDSLFGGKLPSSTFEEVVVKICTSMRAYGCLQREKEGAEKEGRDMLLQLVLNPWDEGMDAGKEFRVFVPPPAARERELVAAGFRISAISQYKWPFEFEAPWGFTVEQTIEKASAGAEKALVEIIEYAKMELSRDIEALLPKYGFSFDVALQEDGSIQLVEINPFGAMSGCGACLFNWVLDGKVLYGLEDEQFAITLNVEGE